MCRFLCNARESTAECIAALDVATVYLVSEEVGCANTTVTNGTMRAFANIPRTSH